MQEGSPTQRPAVGQGCRAVGGVENKLNAAVFDPVDDVGAAFQHLVDLLGLDPELAQVALRSARGDDLETQLFQQLDRLDDARLVDVAHRDEHGSGARQGGAAADLALGEGDVEGAVEAHDLAGRLHLRAEHRVDAREPGEREHGLLHADMLELRRLQVEARERFARHDPRRDLGDGKPDHLGDERHRARGARVHLQHVDVAVLDGVLHVHQAADVERKRQRAGLALQLRDRLGARANAAAASRPSRRSECRLPRCAP